MHQDAQADGEVERTVTEFERVRIAMNEGDRPAGRTRPVARHRQHLLGRVDAGDFPAGPGQQDGRPARAGADVQDGAAADVAGHPEHDRRLRFGDELTDGSAEPPIVEGASGLRVGVDGVAVMIGRHHAASSAHARRVRSRYAW